MAQSAAVKPMTILAGAVVAAGLVAAALALLRSDPWGEGKTVPDAEPIDPALIKYDEVGQIASGMEEVRGVAVGPDGAVWIAGDRRVQAFDPGGAPQSRQIACQAPPQAVAVAGTEHTQPGRVYVAVGDHVEVFEPDGRPAASWAAPAAGTIFTALAVGEGDVFAADVGNRIVWRFDADGQVQGRIGQRDPQRKVYGFVITDRRHFDIAIGAEGLLHAVNPRLLRVEVFSPQGDLRSHWGQGSTTVEGFFGCCNPAHLAALPDGRFVTAEKGAVRVKVYGPQGKLSAAVAGPQHLSDTPADLATDAAGRVLVLDAAAKSVRIFAPKAAPQE